MELVSTVITLIEFMGNLSIFQVTPRQRSAMVGEAALQLHI